jgi:hypothetical protein
MSFNKKTFQILKLYMKNARLVPRFNTQLHDTIKPISVRNFINIIVYNLKYESVIELHKNLTSKEFCASFFIQCAGIVQKSLPEPGTPYGLLFASKLSKRMMQSNLDCKNVTANFDTTIPQKDLNFDKNQILCKSHMSLFQHVIDIKDIPRYQITCGLSKETYSEFREATSDMVGTKEIFVTDVFTNAKNINLLRIFCINNKTYKLVLDILFDYFDRDNVNLYLGVSKAKSIYKMLGPCMFFIFQLNYIFCQLYNKIPNDYFMTEKEQEIVILLMYQISGNQLISLNRAGMKLSDNNSGLEKICFEAPKQNLYNEALKETSYNLNDSQSRLFFGQRIVEGTGYAFNLEFEN